MDLRKVLGRHVLVVLQVPTFQPRPEAGVVNAGHPELGWIDPSAEGNVIEAALHEFVQNGIDLAIDDAIGDPAADYLLSRPGRSPWNIG